jgi:glycosyltransferase involved in cell wall biosynthesis
MSCEPTISVITAAYNGSKYLPAMLDSVLAQDLKDYEHIVINDGSDDDGATERVLSAYEHLKVIHQENQGQYSALNVGLELARGKYIVIINQDDAFAAPDVFTSMISRMEEDWEIDSIYGKIQFFDENGELLPYVRARQKKHSRWFITQVSCIHHGTLFVRRSLLEEHNLRFDPYFRMAGDWDWIIGVIRHSRKVEFVDRYLVSFRLHSSQKTWRGGRQGFKSEEKRICRRHGNNYLISVLLRFYIDTVTRFNIARGIIRKHGLKHFFSRLFRFIGRSLRGK